MRDLPVPDVPTTTLPNGIGTHLAAIGAFVVSFAGYIPYLFAALPAIYYVILIWESKTVQDFVARRRARKAALNLAKLNAKVLVAGAQIDGAKDVQVAKVVAAANVDNAIVDGNALVSKVAAGVTGPTA